MDNRVIKSLATCALYPYLEGSDSGSDVNGGNGAEFPFQVAAAVLDVPKSGPAADYFAIGFSFGLDVATAIAEKPMHSPDLSPAIAEAKADIAQC
jgi:hypothetical protein